jgi:hypothetical protein
MVFPARPVGVFDRGGRILGRLFGFMVGQARQHSAIGVYHIAIGVDNSAIGVDNSAIGADNSGRGIASAGRIIPRSGRIEIGPMFEAVGKIAKRLQRCGFRHSIIRQHGEGRRFRPRRTLAAPPPAIGTGDQRR